MKKITEISQLLLETVLNEHSIVCDFTLGNGNDTKFFLNKNVKKIYAFEIQKDVIENTKNNIIDYRIEYICDGHQNLNNYINESIDAGIFNFGYCPKGDKNITTKKDTSLEAIDKALHILNVKGRLVLVCYIGHEEGKQEADAILKYCKELDSHYYEVLHINMENRKNCPYILCIEKIRETL